MSCSVTCKHLQVQQQTALEMRDKSLYTKHLWGGPPMTYQKWIQLSWLQLFLVFSFLFAHAIISFCYLHTKRISIFLDWQIMKIINSFLQHVIISSHWKEITLIVLIHLVSFPRHSITFIKQIKHQLRDTNLEQYQRRPTFIQVYIKWAGIFVW